MRPRQQNKSVLSVSYRTWTEKVWAEAEEKWIARDGQDSFYRDQVAIPGLVDNISCLCSSSSFELVDIGSGDGYCTEGLISQLIRFGFPPIRVILLDRSQVQLRIALQRPHLRDAISISCNFLDPNWYTNVPDRTNKRVLVCVFTIQELPSLVSMLEGLSSIMTEEDVAIFLTVAPSYSAFLLRKGVVIKRCNGTTRNDWQWKGLYPIDGAAGRFYLPCFQRTVTKYNQVFRYYGFENVRTTYLAVPISKDANTIFESTVYGKSIVGARSSVILAFRKTHATLVRRRP